ncbi:MCM3AP [Bugula neritina]|uniref:Germinal-center associated nuclear protein n=1 Tax=Bugula neritina TaxID=10212 RepID=A0A7J7KB18_BUGNE|nr:MCM3AP [Bugula neritina]
MPPAMATLRQTPANTCSEKQAVLDKREKIMRLGMSKESDISKARATKGCCPDMCPERERYIREERRRVHLYEMVPGTESQPQIDHRLAVKEYSRSSADQEEPLPLELRPSHVLAKTMEYLCSKIMDYCVGGNWGDWYDFLWNRTRAIRKDITQQHLCSPIAAGLVEKCARFHIYCGARLVEEGPMIFDAKINTENLTKCLQTLKEMYADLVKRGVTCESEAEFRAYIVLMNLNNGDTLREVQQLRQEVRNSPAIAFALSAYAALNDRNYVKFFKLVESATFLNACILHRYFNQIRHVALKIILRAYSAAKGPVSMTFDQLRSVLHFESNDEAAEFLQHYGVLSGASPANLSLSKENFVEPEATLPSKRAPLLVENFDENGYFIGIIKPPPSTHADVKIPGPKLPPLNEIPNQVVKDTVKQLIIRVIDEDVIRLVKESLEDEKQCLLAVTNIADDLVNMFQKELCTELVTEVVNDAKQELIILKQQEEKLLEARACDELVEELIDRVQQEEAQRIAVNVFKEVEAERLEKLKAVCMAEVNKDLLHKHLVFILEEIAEEVYQTDVLDRLQLLDESAEKTRIACCRRFFHRWVARYRNITRVRRSMLAFPAAPSMLPLKRNNYFNAHDKTFQISKKTRFNLGPQTDLVEELRLSNIERMIAKIQVKSPLKMADVIFPVLNDHHGSDYMKLLVSLPPSSTSVVDQRISNWLTTKLSVGSVREAGLLSLYNLTEPNESHRKFGVCVRQVLENNAKQLLGTNMAMILLPVNKDKEPDESYWDEPRQRLEELLSKLQPIPAVPLLIISPLGIAKESVQRLMGVYEYLERGLVSHVKVDRLDVNYNKQLPESIQWLFTHRSPIPPVSLTDMRTLVESYVAAHFLSPVYHDLFDRQHADLVHQDVSEIIKHFNDVITHLATNIVDERQYSWPVYEFHPGCHFRESTELRGST